MLDSVILFPVDNVFIQFQLLQSLGWHILYLHYLAKKGMSDGGLSCRLDERDNQTLLYHVMSGQHNRYEGRAHVETPSCILNGTE